MSEAGKVVCVTGASGFIASCLVKLLLQRGYTVKATVRDPNDLKKVNHLLELDGAKERLHLFKANLLEEGYFNSVVEGCEGVFHTASPVNFNVTDPQLHKNNTNMYPALKGTLNVLRSCRNVPSITRVVITSSIATVLFTGKPLGPDVTVDETWFSNPTFFDKSQPLYNYVVAKILAEEAAWKFAKENGIDMVTIHPGLVIGSLLQPTLNLTVRPIWNLINEGAQIMHDGMTADFDQYTGSDEICYTSYCISYVGLIDAGAETLLNVSHMWVDVRDVASAHVLAMENPSASGRYCLVGSVVHLSEVVKILHKLFPAVKLPDICADDKPFAPVYMVSKKRPESLGLKFTPLELSLRTLSLA
ncbi:cinnamoyl-CoA reductase 1-like [Quillaja saponaria]|uniref:Cinnamoyl-CoA reductase 1-like n=1 Tax=Quillaja saponaria TaxID=32244 RepID=A0AAD7L0I0_QUISA|nr:cinnamoyl-CoA reductase 1-like [Quillaja saponaria]